MVPKKRMTRSKPRRDGRDSSDLLQRSSLEAYSGIALGIIQAVFPMGWYIRALLLVIIAAIIADICWHSGWTAKWSPIAKACAALLLISLLAIPSYKVVNDQYEIENFSNSPAYILSWGPAPGAGGIALAPGKDPRILGIEVNEVVADGHLLLTYRDKYNLMAVCFHNIGTGDVQDIQTLSKSGVYDIEDRAITIEIPWSVQYRSEYTKLYEGTGYELLLLPKNMKSIEFQTIRDAVALGAKRIKRVSGPP